MPKILKCCILGCHENSRNVMEEISFHRIPKDEVTRKQWIDLIRSKTNQSSVFSIHALVCSKHFEKDQFVERVNGSRLLIQDVVPSIFPNERRECFKSDWSDDDDPVTNSTVFPSATVVQSCKNNETDSTSEIKSDVVHNSGVNPSVKCESLEDGSLNPLSNTDGDKTLSRSTNRSSNFRNICRFCLTIPVSTQIEDPASNQDIANMYKSLTGIEFYSTTYVAPETICTTCSFKLKNAFEFREHLIKMNIHWETWIKNDDDADETVAAQEPDPTDMLPKLEVVIYETIEEYLEDDFVDNDDDGDDDVKQEAESDDDDKFIQTVEDFIKTVKPTKPTKLKKIHIPKPSGKLLSAKSARIIAADTERLNFRSTSCPHSSQKLKKDNKWWRLMHDCNYCDAKDFLTVEAINKHLKLQHAELIKATCDICKKDYSELKYLRKHMKYVHQTRQNECTVCKKKFYYNYNLKSHMQIHTNEKTVICHLCGKFFTPSALHAHLKTGIHGTQVKASSSGKEQSVKNTRYYCHICVPAKRFNLCSDLTEHRRLLHNDFECPICRGWFSCTEALQNHLKTHSSKERKHKCSLCSSTFTRASHLEGHMRRKHSSDPKQIACNLCDYKCVEPYELYGHKKHAHSTTKPYKCSLCSKSFTKEQAHKDHMLTTHDIGQYRYFCKECPKRFTNSAGLIHHRGIHHNGVGNTSSVDSK